MLRYTPPVDDMAFALFNVFNAEAEWARAPALAEVDEDLAKAVLSEAGKLAVETLLPSYQSSDAEGARWHDGAVVAPTGFRAAFNGLAQGGWLSVSGNPDHGGQGLPKMLTVLVEEMFWAANTNLYLYGTLTIGVATCLDAHADAEIKRRYLPRLYRGEWTGAMALTEPHAGTDLGLIRTRAEPLANGTYAITGNKIFITSGEHDLAENIVHLVLAKLPDAPPGSSGISLFLVPKFLPHDDADDPAALECEARPSVRNGFVSRSIEHKMGIRGSATSAIEYDAAVGYLIGEPNRGLACMFTMMNHARVSVGIQGLGLADLAYQNAVAYARERPQGRAASGPRHPNAEADSILVHADVRRMLLAQRAFTEGGRALAIYVGLLLDRAEHSADKAWRNAAQAAVDLLTPVAKAFLTDRAMECALLAQQTFGGHGYIAEHGMEQIVRDVRISQIYEGANGVQALDFTVRKVLRDRGQALRRLLDDFRAEAVPEEFKIPLHAAVDATERAAEGIATAAATDPDAPGAASADFLELAGLTIYAWLWARMAQAAMRATTGRGDAAQRDRHEDKLEVARFFFAKLLPKTVALERGIQTGAATVMALPEERF